MSLDHEKMKLIRERLKMTQLEAAIAAGLGESAQRWNDIESGRRTDVKISTLNKIAKALRVRPATLLK